MAHPRSRGENSSREVASRVLIGSSPLTRGKPHPMAPRTAGGRLIPAHAGKTHGLPPQMMSTGAHPRSRGENAFGITTCRAAPGSSPLTRGKPDPRLEVGDLIRLIPAHAGKTTNARGDKIAGAAHPRSRGENIDGFVSGIKSAGSSPLTRGKRAHEVSRSSDGRLIPAHAGKTDAHRTVNVLPQAHPRSRGENMGGGCRVRRCWGSSPLTRGKPPSMTDNMTIPRLIPAHAGKTHPPARRACPSAAHPRSRGENPVVRIRTIKPEGSSPLTRGKPSWLRGFMASWRLIPAHAGKTDCESLTAR
mgnify:CR=1 FL=1